MSNTGRLARQAFELKPAGLSRQDYQFTASVISQITDQVDADVSDAAYAAIVSYSEALGGFSKGSTSWGVVKLYYAYFYCIRSLLLASGAIPFHSKDHLIFDIKGNSFVKGGASSHHWNWSGIRKIRRLDAWYYSSDSEEFYGNLRDRREDSNYRFAFIDPKFPSFINNGDGDVSKIFRVYRDGSEFFYTYLVDHYVLAYPTALIFALDTVLSKRDAKLTSERRSHVKKIWPLKDRCPIVD
jgi:hypothetical protein